MYICIDARPHVQRHIQNTCVLTRMHIFICIYRYIYTYIPGFQAIKLESVMDGFIIRADIHPHSHIRNTNTYMHTDRHTDRQIDRQAYKQAGRQAYIQIHTCMHAHTHTYIHTCMHAYVPGL